MEAYDRPITILDRLPSTGDYHAIPIDRTDPRYHEPLVDAHEWGLKGENYYGRTDGRNPPYNRPINGAIRQLWCRRTIAAKLTAVNRRLVPYRAEVFIWDAYRPIACQRGLWDYFFARFRGEMPDAAEPDVVRRVQQYVSDPRRFDPDDATTWPVHVTGAAIDLTLYSADDGRLLDLGAPFDAMDATSHSDHFERLLRAGAIAHNDARLRNRRLLHWAMAEEGFANYGYEFWHFDYGDQLYVLSRRQHGNDQIKAAWYGYVPPPSNRT